jgi:hypothetical protein
MAGELNQIQFRKTEVHHHPVLLPARESPGGENGEGGFWFEVKERAFGRFAKF